MRIRWFSGLRLFVLVLLAFGTIGELVAQTTIDARKKRRVPAEWQPQDAIWLQWPQRFEKTYEPAFAKMSAIIIRYENLHILVTDQRTRNEAKGALKKHGGLGPRIINGGRTPEGFRITWHSIKNDNAWMRDNGPIFVDVDGQLTVQNWDFDAWGGGFGPRIPFANDKDVPVFVAEFLGLSVENVDIVHERGDLEFNGKDTVILNWSVIGDPKRNPKMTRKKAIRAMKKNFGVKKVVLIEGAPQGDGTKGHVDGIARFVSENKVIVADCSSNGHCSPGGPDDQIYDNAAGILADAGFDVERMPFEAAITYKGQTFDSDYMNWLVGNGFVIAVGFGHAEADAIAVADLQRWFPDRDIHMIEMLDSWIAGGGVHCHTNDQPATEPRS